MKKANIIVRFFLALKIAGRYPNSSLEKFSQKENPGSTWQIQTHRRKKWASDTIETAGLIFLRFLRILRISGFRLKRNRKETLALKRA
jgi:hypothetical protein